MSLVLCTPCATVYLTEERGFRCPICGSAMRPRENHALSAFSRSQALCLQSKAILKMGKAARGHSRRASGG